MTRSSISNKIVRPTIRAFLLLVMIFQMVCLGNVSVCKAAEVDNDQLFSKEAFQKDNPDKEQIKRIQATLLLIGYDPKQNDGIIGKNTINALVKFCEDLVATGKEDLANKPGKALDEYLTFAIDHANWKEEVSSEAFRSWLKEEYPAKFSIEGDTPSIVIYAAYLESNKGAKKQKDVGSKEKVLGGPGVYYLLTEKDLLELKEINENIKKKEGSTEVLIPDAILEKMTKVQDVAYANKGLFRKSINKILDEDTKNDSTYKRYLGLNVDIIVDMARKGPVKELIPINISSDSSCGCVSDFSGIVYGFYPYWLASDKGEEKAEGKEEKSEGEKEDIQKLDFSVLTRIGYYAITLDKDGQISAGYHWGNKKRLGNFIKIAHQYRSKVDLVVYTNSWVEWSEDSIIDYAVRQIAKKINPINDGVVDGITVYFDGSVNKKTSENLNRFITKLHQELKNNNNDFFINIMINADFDPNEENVSCDPNGDVAKVFKNLEKLLPNPKDEMEGYVDLVMVFLEEPTTYTKKKLRNLIEKQFHGYQRRQILRKIIPVISPTGHYPLITPNGHDQFYDDLIYFQDNFKGIGFWPLPMSTDKEADSVKDKIIEVYGTEERQDWIERKMAWLCKFQCPNRWWFRIGADALLAFWLVFILLAIFYFCNTVKVIKKFALPLTGMLLITIAVVFPWFACDPYMKGRQTDFLIGMLFVGIILVAIVMIKRMRQGQMP